MTSNTVSAHSLAYPDSPQGDQVDIYHGVEVPDPYRWLEEPQSPASRQWIEAQNRVTFSYLEQLPRREQINQRLTNLWNYERYGTPFKRGDRYFYLKTDCRTRACCTLSLLWRPNPEFCWTQTPSPKMALSP